MIISGSEMSMSAYSSYTYNKSSSLTTKTTYHGNNGTENSSSVVAKLDYRSERLQASKALFTTGETETEKTDVLSVNNSHEQQREKEAEPVYQDVSAHLNNIGSAISSLPDLSNPKLSALQSMLELLTGRKSKGNIFSASLNSFGGQKSANNLRLNTHLPDGISSLNFKNLSAPAMKLSEGKNESSLNTGTWTRQISEEGQESGKESFCFKTEGQAITSDGRSISFSVTMEMSRSFASSYSITGEEKEFTMCDPLVINLSGENASVTDMTFKFDLNNDGKKEEISTLSKGSAFLALDRNNDGKVNSGSELFGTRTGDGFSELAAYDDDGNGWIDEGDSVYQRLSVWSKNEDGSDSLIALSEAGVGAIFLGSAEADYTLTDSSGDQRAQVRSTGVFLNENGTSGTIQHIDFKI